MKRLLVPGAVVGAIILLALSAPLLGLENPVKQDVAQRLSSAGSGAWLGRDEFGRDVLSRLIWGARTSLSVAFASAIIACCLGTALGLFGGWFRGVGEFFAVRSMDVILCFPPVLLALLVVTLVGPGAGSLIFVLSILYLPGFVRVAYAETLTARNHDYVLAVRALGAPTGRILLRTLLPNIAGPVLVQLSLAVAAAVVLESGLSFLGLGVVPPSPSWGLMIRGARATMEQAPMLLVWPCSALTLTILAMNVLCDSLRDVVDPRTSATRKRIRLIDRLLPGLTSNPGGQDIIRIENLTVEIDTPRGKIRPVEGVNIAVKAGETLAIVGESGSGKSLTALAAMGLLPPAAMPVEGAAWFDDKDLLRLPEPDLRKLRGGPISMVFQDPMSSLNPVHRTGDQVSEAILAHSSMSRTQARAMALSLFRQVGIADPEARVENFPHEMSGGMKQRVMIAMALANQPALLIADEPTTALDVTVQAQILDLLGDLKRKSGTALIFITHSLAVVAEIADRVTVMYAGQVIEEGPVDAVFRDPLHPYTSALLAASPEGGATLMGIPGTVPQPHAFPKGCRFAPRCPHAKPVCGGSPIELKEVRSGRSARCIRWDELNLAREAAQ
ncbi:MULTISPECIES: dipeptide/oligopeptide/nickel ABC transporter permease/ATP-binding protein [Rhizobium/Agrobacterium group]|uniref:dipeptide/oligopeptide/nickel ABC transporter permease/ATP-binding protein n=1 Tax=Rhizobium/Agrobacterium group TaxID=227290 RepID=UPI0008DC077F|nr:MULTISPECIES: dipeptide/oligopeptide/nickel ABC transporter permease/ATP-binding protein [Rhizobium/Agrobacterium group]MCF1436503.1 dipeptide/oligopeptide/nickel ABC transporter permease/ATP-binding protein [Allorhizobium ampelinum]MCF1464478.1 dipeptide/oligopeptide/nickel ABC transporter permease/ATP-binding protein [Allorhizobium ampelinum]MCF1495846.1 dipeptide/oligopeptide/nickel ABC transporter permease/ATP-binding protein [Allorhizobium ampelinum]MUO91212.1 ATP-binding cassette domai